MRLKNLTKSISIILMLLAMMFSCTQVCENIDSGNSNSNNTNQGGNNNGGSNSGNQNGGNAGGEQTADTITITLIGTDDKEFNKFDIKIGEEIELPANVERFLCWNTKADGKGESYTGKSKFNKDMTLYLIVLAENAYTITYELNGGVNDKTNPLSFTADEKITLKEPSKDGYRFSGWYETANFTGTAVKGWTAGDKKANVTLYAKWRAFDDKVLAEGGTGVYNYTINIDALSGQKDYPEFSIFLMTDGQIESMKSDGNKGVGISEILEATKTNPVYQICRYGEMRTDTTKTGDYAVWGNTPVNGKLEYYEGISASIKGTALSITVDMTKLANAELKSYLDGEKTFMTDDDTVSLSNYKPYISMSLDYAYDDYDSYIVVFDFDGMYERLYGMNSGASFPTNLKEDAPAVPTCYDLTYCYTYTSQIPVVELKNNAYTFVAPVGVETNQVKFYFMNYNPIGENVSYPVFPMNIGGEPIDSLNKNFPLDDIYNPKNYNFQIKSGVLTAGNMYTITLDVRGNNDAYAKVSEVKPTSIKINSTTHKTSYYEGDDINVANLTVEATTAAGKKFTVNVTADMISGFDSSKLGKQTVTITLKGCTATYSVDVNDVKVRELNVTADELVDTIKGLTDGEYYKIKVSGTLDRDTMSDIQDEMDVSNAADYPKIALDLGNTTGLTYNSFYDCYGLTSIVFPEGMTSIPSFYDCSNLTSITIPASVKNVGSISNCKKLTTFEVAENNESFSTSADGKMILYSKDKTVLVSYPSASGDVTIPNSVTSIGNSAFRYCSSLTSVIIPDSVTSIGNSAFYYCESLTSVIIPDSVTSIGNYAFQNCKNLKSVIIPDSVTSIGSYAFQNCENLESVTIGAGVTSISSDSFRSCSSLTSIEVDSANPNYSSSSDGKMLLSKDKTTLVAYPSATGDVRIPNSVISIGSYAFYYCESLTNVTIPDSVTSIGNYAFYYCESLTNVTIPDSVTKIGSYAFSGCEALTSVTIPDSVITIGYYAFIGCENLASVTFTDTNDWYYTSNSNYTDGTAIDVTDTAQNATYLKSTYNEYWYKHVEITVTGDNVAKEISKLPVGNYTVVVTGAITNETISAIKTALQNNSSAMVNLDLSETTGLTEIPYEAFYNCRNLASMTIPDSVTSIGNYAFYYCNSLESVTFGNGVTEIGNSAFEYCRKLTTITIPDSVTSIGSQAFLGCSSLTSVTIPDSVTTISGSAFSYCSSLESVTIPDSVTTISGSAFSDCNSLTSVTIPDSVTSIGGYAFYDCSSLTSVTFADTNNWYYTENYDYTDGTAIDVTDTAQNATYLKDTYYDKYWYKE